MIASINIKREVMVKQALDAVLKDNLNYMMFSPLAQ